MYACSQTYIWVSIHVCMYICREAYTSLYVCVHAYQACSCVTIHIFVISLNRYDCHIENMNHMAIMLCGPQDPTFLHICAKMEPTEISTSHVVAIYMPKQECHSNTTYILHMQISSLTDIRHPCQCNQEHLYTYILHYWYMPLNKYACHIAYICPTALLLQYI